VIIVIINYKWRLEMTEFTEVHCLHCNSPLEIHDGEIRTLCNQCLFYNTILPEETFQKLQQDQEIDPLFVHKKKREERFHYSWPSLTKEEFLFFKKRAPKRAEALLKRLRNQSLSEEENQVFRSMIFRFKNIDLQEKIEYLKIKQKILQFFR